MALDKKGAIKTTTVGFVDNLVEQKGALRICRITGSALECSRLGDGDVMRIPYTKPGFRPVDEGEVMASYAIERRGVVAVYYTTRRRDTNLDGLRRFIPA